jgi:hypothetical protein
MIWLGVVRANCADAGVAVAEDKHTTARHNILLVRNISHLLF